MKSKALLVALVFCIAVTASAAASNANGFWVGPTAFYNIFLDPEDLESHEFDSDNFSYGIDARLRMGLLEGSLMAIYYPSSDTGGYSDVLAVYANAGANLNLSIFNVGLSGGTNFLIIDDDAIDEAIDFGVNLKATADVMLGNIALGFYYMAILDTFEDFDADNISGNVGVSLLFKPF